MLHDLVRFAKGDVMRKTVWDLEENEPAINWDGTKPIVDTYGVGHVKDLGWFHAGGDTDEREYWFVVGETKHQLKVFDKRQRRRFNRIFKKSNAANEPRSEAE
jgi:hypothetical protein